MAQVLSLRSSCLVSRPPNSPVCGNGVLEGWEECDCGHKEASACAQLCCTPQCKLVQGAQCSPLNGPCCSSTCTYTPRNSKECSPTSECSPSPSLCSGSSALCPPPPPSPTDGALCEGG